MGAVESLAAWGIVRPAEVVEIAAATRLPLALAASLLEQESAGGFNRWGHDGVDTGGSYVKGAEVTRAAYEQYRALVQAKTIGRQGVGPTQLTNGSLQDQADRLGGCWDWRINLTVGLRHLAALVQQYGLADGVRRYNGSGPAAETYRDKMLARYQRWTDRLGAHANPVMPVPSPTPGVLVALTDAEQAELLDLVRKLKPGVMLPGRGRTTANVVDDQYGWAITGAGRASDALAEVQQLRAELADLRNTVARMGGAGDPAAFAAAVADQISARLRE